MCSLGDSHTVCAYGSVTNDNVSAGDGRDACYKNLGSYEGAKGRGEGKREIGKERDTEEDIEVGR